MRTIEFQGALGRRGTIAPGQGTVHEGKKEGVEGTLGLAHGRKLEVCGI